MSGIGAEIFAAHRVMLAADHSAQAGEIAFGEIGVDPILAIGLRPRRLGPLDRRLQPKAPAFRDRLPHPRGFRENTYRNRRSAAQPRPYVDGPLASSFFGDVYLAIAVICPACRCEAEARWP
jgi:hypothetical protein